MKAVFLPLFVAGLHLAVQTKSPVEKVVELINELKAKIEADGAIEQKTYDKFACWCETTTQRKADNIDAGKKLIGTTTTTILTLKGAIAVLASEIAEHEADIAKNNEEMKKLTGIREKENSDYQEDKNYMETAIGSLHSAIEVLGGAGTGGDMGLLKVASKVRSAVLDSPKLSALSESNSKLLKSFLENPGSFLSQEPEDYYDKKAQAKASYSPQSATVMGILKDMYDTFAADLEKSNQDESNAQKGFEDVIDEKTKKNKVLQGMVTAKNAEKAEKSQQLAENEQLLEATQAQLKADEEFFATARESCKDKSDEWDERSRMRTEELTGINKALEILTSDEARETFQSAHDTRAVDTFGSEGVDVAFVQVEEESSPRAKAYRALKKVARMGGKRSLMLARLAANVRAATTGHFDEVIASIDTMLQTLKDEEAEDIKQRDWCIEDRHTNRNDRDDLAYDISQLEAKIERAEVKKKGLETDVANTEQAKEDLIADMEQALADRTAENENFHAAKDDDLKAIGLLEDAIAAMSSYGANNPAFLQKEPVFEVSEDQAPDATFSSGDKHKGASDGIVSLLTHIKENLENEVGLATKSEAKATEEYDALKKSSDEQIELYDGQIVDLNAAIAATDAEIEEDTNTKSDTTDEKTAIEEYLAKIKPNCDWIESAFTKRAEARKKESEGLQQAKSILAGSEGGEFGFLQRH